MIMEHIATLHQQSFTDRVGDYRNYPDGWRFIGPRPCVVLFHATWCSYCRALYPLLDDLAGEYGDRIDFYGVNVDEEELLETAFGVQKIPTLLLCPLSGQSRLVLGVMGKPELKKIIGELLA